MVTCRGRARIAKGNALLVSPVRFACIGAYVLLLGVASFVERPVGKGFSAFQLNVLIRGRGVMVGVAALVVIHGIGLPAPQLLLAGVGIGIIAGSASICYSLASAPSSRSRPSR